MCKEFSVVHSWRNGTRCRDGVNVWLVFEGSILTCACFHSENIFVTCSCCFFFLEIVREKRGGKGREGEDAWSVKYDSIELCCSQRTKIHLRVLEAQAKPHKILVQST